MRVTNKFYGAILIGIFVLGINNLIHAQTWQSLNGPLESDISKVIVQNDTIYVSSTELGGFFKKHKDADRWTLINISELVEVLNTIEIGPNSTYYTMGSGPTIGDFYFRFSKSYNFGKNWEFLHEGLDDCSGLLSGDDEIVVTAKESLIISCGDRIFKFDEEDDSFKETSGNPTLSSNPVFSFYEFEDTLAAGRVSGFEYSTDDGDSWTASAFDSVEVFSFEYMDGTWLAGTKAGLYSSTSISGTFEQVEDLSDVQVHALHKYQNHIIAGTDSGAFRVDPVDFDIQPIFQGVDLSPVKAINNTEEIILFGTENGIYECSLDEEDCERTGVPNSRVRALSIPNQDTVFAGTIWRVHRYFISADRWDTLSVPVGRAKSFIQISADSFYTVNNTHFFACSFQSSGCDSTRVEEPGTALFDLKQNTASDLFLASRTRVFKSSDKGKNWEVIYTSPEKQNISLVTYSDSLLFINNDRIRYNLATNTYDTLSKTVDIITQNGTIYSHGNGIHKSTNLGETWTTLLHQSDAIGGDILIDILYDETTEKLYAIGNGGRVYVSEDKGANWGVNEEMHPIYIEDAAIDPNGTLYIGTDNAGVFTNTEPLNPPITISNEEEPGSNIPKKFSLKQNYPNPFNPSTTVPFELSQASEVRISLYNVFGQKVREYTLGRKIAGTHHHQINMDQQASGVYFLEVRAGEHSEVIKMSFIK